MIEITMDKKFTKEKVQALFLSQEWVSGEYPERLYKALMNSGTVITAWDGEELVGLARVIDDTELLAVLHYVIVRPDYEGMGIASTMIEMIKQKYENYLYIEGMPELKNVPFYEKQGFKHMKDSAMIQLANYLDKR